MHFFTVALSYSLFSAAMAIPAQTPNPTCRDLNNKLLNTKNTLSQYENRCFKEAERTHAPTCNNAYISSLSAEIRDYQDKMTKLGCGCEVLSYQIVDAKAELKRYEDKCWKENTGSQYRGCDMNYISRGYGRIGDMQTLMKQLSCPMN
jgi:hypothetical protein